MSRVEPIGGDRARETLPVSRIGRVDRRPREEAEQQPGRRPPAKRPPPPAAPAPDDDDGRPHIDVSV